MIHQLGQVMLYVDDQETALQFWTEHLDFQCLSDQKMGEMRIIEIAPKDAATSIVLHDKHLISQMQPELFIGTPSFMFYSSDLDALFARLKAVTTVGEIVEMMGNRVFNFSDFEGNYFAVMEK